MSRDAMRRHGLSLQSYRWEISHWVDATNHLLVGTRAVVPEDRKTEYRMLKQRVGVSALDLHGGPFDGRRGVATRCEDWLTPHQLHVADDFPNVDADGHYKLVIPNNPVGCHRFTYRWIEDAR